MVACLVISSLCAGDKESASWGIKTALTSVLKHHILGSTCYRTEAAAVRRSGVAQAVEDCVHRRSNVAGTKKFPLSYDRPSPVRNS